MTEQIKASFDTETKEGKFKIFNAKNGAGRSLKTVSSDEVLSVVDVLIYHDSITSFSQNASAQEGEITTLFTEDGELFGGVSAPVSKAAQGLIDLLDAGLSPIQVKVITGKSNNGRDFLNLQVVG